jgi:hypothetical protein
MLAGVRSLLCLRHWPTWLSLEPLGHVGWFFDEAALRDEVRRFLRLNAGTLRYLASKLARCGRLSGNEVEQLVRGAKRLRARKGPSDGAAGIHFRRGQGPSEYAVPADVPFADYVTEVRRKAE